MNYLDIVLAIILVYAAYKGWKTGGISSLLNLVGTLIVIVVSYFLKDPISVLLYKNLPFFSFGGLFLGITSINICVYEAVSYLICVFVLGTLLALLVKVTGLIDKLVNKTIILSLPSKILGIVASVLQSYIFCFVLVFIMTQVPLSTKLVQESTVAPIILERTPLMSQVTNGVYHTVTEIYDIAIKADGEADKTKANYDALEVLLKYKVISTKNAKDLLDKGKLQVENSDELLEKYKNQ
jgi:uncharacterized membrane protein required for colicin V production